MVKGRQQHSEIFCFELGVLESSKVKMILSLMILRIIRYVLITYIPHISPFGMCFVFCLKKFNYTFQVIGGVILYCFRTAIS